MFIEGMGLDGKDEGALNNFLAISASLKEGGWILILGAVVWTNLLDCSKDLEREKIFSISNFDIRASVLLATFRI